MLDSLRLRILGIPYPPYSSERDEACRQAQKARPIAYWLLETAPWWVECQVWNGAKAAWRWVRHRLYPRYWPIIRTGLKPGWHDLDAMMLHGCMALLCRYVEDELGGEDKAIEYAEWLDSNPDPNVPSGFFNDQANGLRESVRIYRWWKQYPENAENGLDGVWGEAYWKAVEANRDKENEMLKRLVEFRHMMWT